MRIVNNLLIFKQSTEHTNVLIAQLGYGIQRDKLSGHPVNFAKNDHGSLTKVMPSGIYSELNYNETTRY